MSVVDVDTFSFDASLVSSGLHQIVATVTDTSRMVRTDSAGLLTSSITWQIDVGGLTTGDCQLDSVIDAADIIYLVTHVFKSGANPIPCPAVGDVNCSAAVDAADIIALVNYVFKGGSEPFDICALIPGIWTCF